ncbi:hypothetical protein N7491_004788 [Penicillium cf. griseofulvum]|uniref:Uncharacterized protein n=1 Tax=Penicillium cf. griseofulvum TaxID=2972120 RepID=A0A9W9J1Y8_9EURO|nr:hypothetical protein N7472_007477 [Penicillium cf. griseofulvum]KAJ5434193.1 hypothetical protein N7491_004788 [Penicillium cf. griseofulvum]KAJ5452018.1 hypothetical protein N7445_000201 [Penicillium cf. griseofulvum]
MNPHWAFMTTVDPPDIKSYKAFMEFYGKNTRSHLSERSTVETVEDFRGDFEAGMSRRRKYHFPSHVSTTIREVRLSIPFPRILYIEHT